ncbi:hypothetical protein KC19_2G227800 [Ceratodon purpureus]|uniref:F-box domain-containing protein n=1 Tax=Ceratodon purpureus TaxID=3225 RepID=A0A8T0IZQ2_CERPU|nr:hypothetical protein KC19_2G227800 [Ceratodon purpureus]
MKCCVVCKHWNTLISSPHFIKILTSANDNQINCIPLRKVDFITGLLQKDEFCATQALQKNLWTTIWDQLAAVTLDNTTKSMMWWDVYDIAPSRHNKPLES